VKLLHLVIDDKFIDAAIREFEAVAPGRHEYVMLDARPPYRYVKDDRVRRVDAAEFAREAARDDVRAVVFHCLPPAHIEALRNVPPGRHVIWIGWGYDYYGLLNDAFPDGLLGPATAGLLARMAAPPPGAAALGPVPTVLSFARPYRKPTAHEVEALRRVDVFCPVLDTEYRLARRHQPWLRAQHLRWNYGTVEDDFSLAEAPAGPPGPNLLVGNSATPANNHLELFEIIRRRIDLAGRQVVVPLSYGDAGYRRHVLQAGAAAFGAAFVPLVDYMPREDYIRTLASCGFALMNHVRQQALGNIYISALLGARIFLDRRNPLHAWLRDHGLPVADIEQADTVPLSGAERDAQAGALVAGMGRAAQRERTRRLVDFALSPPA
jgi:dTDP-N-acetylfucosamine:lipid II N-acetylfucosaminyltransferase